MEKDQSRNLSPDQHGIGAVRPLSPPCRLSFGSPTPNPRKSENPNVAQCGRKKEFLHIENNDYFAVKDGSKLLPVWRDTEVQKTDEGIQRTRTIERNKRTFIVHSIHPSSKETPTGKLLELAIQEAEDCHK